MTDFLDILTHGRRLQGATKSLSIAELEEVQEKLNVVIEKRREMQVAEETEIAEKQAKIAEIRQQMIDAGLDISDFDAQHANPTVKVSRRKGQKRPVKYSIEQNGEVTKWTGIGRMPVVFREALAAGRDLEEFSV
jgi:DNA-binding protein H-NS